MNARLKLSIIRGFDRLPTSKMVNLSEEKKEYRRKLSLEAFHHRTDEEKLEAKELNKIFHKLFKLNDPRA